jgi:predicted HNH restriction endonuclease
MVNAYERDPEARMRCIAAHRTDCCICGFSFGAAYGPEADGFIHVHHVKALSEVGGEYVVDPVKDLRPVCPNCHAVLHLGGQCRTIAKVKRILVKQRKV